jgi:dGTPase
MADPAEIPDLVKQREALLAPYAMHSADSAGRQHSESPHPYRGPYQRDRDRIIHSAAFRRLAHKMQVFTGDLGDYHRTRLTHTLEVASIARTLARALQLNEDLVETLALAHDLGHPPFGHAGEDVLNECLADQGGFNHNQHALRLVEELEIRYQDFPGLNLSHEVLEGQRYRTMKEDAAQTPLLEIQVVDAADSVAYDSHDVDDALELGLISFESLAEIPLWQEATSRVQLRWTNLDPERLRRAVIHELIDLQVSDLISQNCRWVGELHSIDAVRSSAKRIGFCKELSDKKQELERFLFDSVYRHPRVLEIRDDAQAALDEMFRTFVAQPEQLPEHFQTRIGSTGLPRTVADYLAGMTDRFAWQTHAKLKNNHQ